MTHREASVPWSRVSTTVLKWRADVEAYHIGLGVVHLRKIDSPISGQLQRKGGAHPTYSFLAAAGRSILLRP